MTSPSARERYAGALLGLACGDAVGTTVEFCPRGSFKPLTDMVGGGPFALAPGQWTDDTSMALCLATSLVTCGGFDAADQMTRYLRWRDDGYLSSNGRCFDIGGTVRIALEDFRRTREPFAGSTHPRSAGNGSLMRLAPVVLFYAPDVLRAVEHAALSSRTTHGAPEAIECCRLLGFMLVRILAGASRPELLDASPLSLREPRVLEIARGSYRSKTREQIAGTGYCVASLEAALWCFHSTSSFEEAVLAAANLGDDADTTAAIVGQLAGAFYGVDGIPARWLERLHMRDEIAALAEALFTTARTLEAT
jgi:ADP-ribosyl-[dinitrogen reductase] hydrolase